MALAHAMPCHLGAPAPTWMHGPPAILKGWLDRVMPPGVAFRVGAGRHRILKRVHDTLAKLN